MIFSRLHRIFLLGLSTALGLSLSSAATADPILVGNIGSLSGKDASFGQAGQRGLILAIEEINAANGIQGRPIKLIHEDNRSTAGESATIARKLISRDKVIAIIGETTSGRSLEVAPLAQRARIPMITPSGTNIKVTQAGNYIVRTCFIDPFQGEIMARFAHDKLNFRKVAILSSTSSAYSVELSKEFEKRFTTLGGKVVAEQKYAEGDRDFNAQLTTLKNAGAEAIFIPGYYTEVALAVRQARALGIQLPFFGGDGWEAPELLQIGGDSLNGCYYSAHFSSQNNNPQVAAFVKNYQARWDGATPDAFAALGYDTGRVLADALRRADSTKGPDLQKALAATKDLPGVTGKTTFDKNGNPAKSAVIIAIENGKTRFHSTIDT